MNQDLTNHLRALSRMVYYVTDEEDRFVNELSVTLKDYLKKVWVFNAVFGLTNIEELQRDWKNRTHKVNTDARDIHAALEKVYKDDPREDQHFYVITDPERWLKDPHVVRRLLNIVHQLHNDIRTVKILIFVGPRLAIPETLSRYMEVVHDQGLDEKAIKELVDQLCGYLRIKPPANSNKMFAGLTSYEVEAAVAQSIVQTKKESDPARRKRIDPGFVGEYKRRRLRKTDLLQLTDVGDATFDTIGGNDRFKEWANKTKAAWTNEGAKFGLKPPKGVLLVGVWGCGKSICAKSMGSAWNLPVVSMEMGKLRSSAVGESESNVYRATRLIESVAPCVVWIDEAEKSLSGSASSSQSDAGTTARTIGILSSWLQETDAKVCLVMTANSLKTLPVEFINRMDERFFFDLPNEEERIAILKIHLIKKGQNPDDFQLAELAEAAKKMVGREIEQAIGAAMVDSFEANCKALDQDILLKTLKTKPRIFKTMEEDLREIVDWVGYDEEVDEGIRARFASNRRSESFQMVLDAEGTSEDDDDSE